METRRKREVAYRVFSSELNSASQIQTGVDTYDPNYIVTELGAKINRVFICGVFTEKENVGAEDDPLWRARVVDPTGAFFISAGRFQPEASKIISELEPPQTLAMVGKIRTFTSDDGRFFVSVRPEMVKSIDTDTRNQWILESCQSLLRRLDCLKEALRMEDPTVANLTALGFNKLEADGVITAIKLYNYEDIDLSEYDKQVRELLINLREGLYDLEIMPNEMNAGFNDSAEANQKQNMDDNNIDDTEAKENIIRDLVKDLDKDPKMGVLYQKVLEAAESQGLSRDDTEEAVNVLMNKGIVFEPSLGYLKSVENED